MGADTTYCEIPYIREGERGKYKGVIAKIELEYKIMMWGKEVISMINNAKISRFCT